MSSSEQVDIGHLKQLSLQSTIDYSKACKESKYAAILLQHIKDAKPLEDFIGHYKYTDFTKNNLLHVLFIIYHALSSLSKNFTHYDLHTSNVLLYEPEKGKYIQYHYQDEDGTEITFSSPYIPKIIDYGRSFFDNGNMNSRKIYDKICSVKDCGPKCGEDSGFIWLNPTPAFMISSSQKNESHDLRLLNIIGDDMKNAYSTHHKKPIQTTFIEVDKILQKVVYGVGLSGKDKTYGTTENLKISPDKIYNVNGAYLALKQAVKNPKVISENKKKYNDDSNKLGDIHCR
jgi:hypothetical protein